jgi:hypothetical protein
MGCRRQKALSALAASAESVAANEKPQVKPKGSPVVPPTSNGQESRYASKLCSLLAPAVMPSAMYFVCALAL